MSQTATAYAMGHDDRERRRLALQASILNPYTENLMRRAGISTGMHVVDLGCGVGDVSLLAAGLVGPQGSVTSVDIDPVALATVQSRAAERRLTNISVVQSSVHDYSPTGTCDAVTGRHILVHIPDPLVVLKRIYQWLHGGGVAVFQEYDMSMVHASYPPCPLRDRLMRVFRDAFCPDGLPGTGTRLLHIFWEAGFPPPDCRAEYPIDGGPDSLYYEWFAESYRSVFPFLRAKGLTEGLEDIDPETLIDKLREEAVALKAGSACPVMIGAFARKP